RRLALAGHGDHVAAELLGIRLRHGEHPSSEDQVLTDQESTKAGAVPFVIHLLRNTFRYAGRQYWAEMSRDLKPVYTGGDRGRSPGTVHRIHHEMGTVVSRDRPVVGQRLGEFIPFLDYDIEIRRIICSTNAIESLNARYSARSEPADTSRPSKPH
ncbi:transposase, partial [Nocardia brasiliensis]|uniref:transposase n=1 Tax=Nocardia brasiliensis TaxID=37326 RepID=UPI002456880F